MDAYTKVFKRKKYFISKGFIDEEVPITFRELVVRDYTRSDLIASSLIQDIVKLGLDNEFFSEEHLFSEDDCDDRQFFIAETSVNKKGVGEVPKVVGVAIVSSQSQNIFRGYFTADKVKSNHIEYLIVDEKYRHIGIGKTLLDFVFNSLDSDIVSTTLYVQNDNSSARALYEKFGFRFSEIATSGFFGIREMFKINNPDFQLLSNIGSKGIEYVYMNCNRSDIIDFFNNIEENSKLVNSNRIEVKALKEKYPFSIELIKEWVLGFEKHKKESPSNTFSSYMLLNFGHHSEDPVMSDGTKQCILKNTKVYKKCQQQNKLGNKIIYAVGHKVKSDIICEKYGKESELDDRYSRYKAYSRSLGF